MEPSDLNFLKGKTSGDRRWHETRRMFCVIDGVAKIAPVSEKDAHLDWFEHAGWVTRDNAADFLNKVVRGFYLPDKNRLYVYQGVGFFFDGQTLAKTLAVISALKDAFNLNGDTEIHLGPMDATIDVKEYARLLVGKLKDLS